SSDRPLMITVAPSAVSVEPIARPIPAVEPVTRASLPDSCKSMVASLTAAGFMPHVRGHKTHVSNPQASAAPWVTSPASAWLCPPTPVDQARGRLRRGPAPFGPPPVAMTRFDHRPRLRCWLLLPRHEPDEKAHALRSGASLQALSLAHECRGRRGRQRAQRASDSH